MSERIFSFSGFFHNTTPFAFTRYRVLLSSWISSSFSPVLWFKKLLAFTEQVVSSFSDQSTLRSLLAFSVSCASCHLNLKRLPSRSSEKEKCLKFSKGSR